MLSWPSQGALVKLADAKRETKVGSLPEFRGGFQGNYSGDHPEEQMFAKYESSSGMQTNIWGPAMWMSIHIVSFNYPVQPTLEDKRHYSTWLVHIGTILPCKYCRENFTKNMAAAGWRWTRLEDNFDTVMRTRHMFSKFCYLLHDNVNQMLKKSSPPFEQVCEKIESMRASCLTEEEKKKMERESKELGCVRPLHKGARGKCVISIVPVQREVEGFSIDKKCMPK